MTESACILYPFEVKHMLAAKRIKEKRKKKKGKAKNTDESSSFSRSGCTSLSTSGRERGGNGGREWLRLNQFFFPFQDVVRNKL